MRFCLVVDLQIDYIARVVPDSTFVARGANLQCDLCNASFAVRNAFVDSVPPKSGNCEPIKETAPEDFQKLPGDNNSHRSSIACSPMGLKRRCVRAGACAIASFATESLGETAGGGASGESTGFGRIRAAAQQHQSDVSESAKWGGTRSRRFEASWRIGSS